MMVCPGNGGFKGQMNLMFGDNSHSRDDHEIYSIMSGRYCYKCLKNSGGMLGRLEKMSYICRAKLVN